MRAAVISTMLLLTITQSEEQKGRPDSFPVRGIHLGAPSPGDMPLVVDFVERELARLGVNVLVLEVNYNYQYRSHPELRGERPLSREDIQSLLKVCRNARVQLIPLFNCLGHQSWTTKTFPLLSVYPEFDETPGRYPNNEGIYCRSYCPRHPDLHEVLFALIDELAEAFEASAFHVGMDEVFLLGETVCPRCREAKPADLFAEEVRRLHEHLSSRDIRMWMWGDRLLEGAVSGIGEWEASTNGTEPAIHLVPKDILICDWHYEHAYPTAGHFALNGFDVLSSPWRKPEVGLAQLDQLRLIRKQGGKEMARRAFGMLQTTWTDPAQFIRAYRGGEPDVSDAARESAECFRQVFAQLGEPDR